MIRVIDQEVVDWFVEEVYVVEEASCDIRKAWIYHVVNDFCCLYIELTSVALLTL
jgi:hypothetical protein